MTAGIVPLCVAVGLIADWPGLVLWAQEASTSKGWLIFFGLAMFAFAGADPAVGLAHAAPHPEPLLLDGHRLDRHRHARDAVPVEGSLRGQVQRLRGGLHRQRRRLCRARSPRLSENGVAVDPSFSFSATIPMVAVFATTAIFSYWSTFVGGELRQASTMKTARQHGARRRDPADRRGDLHGDLLQDVRRRLPARRERRRAPGRDRRRRGRRSST